MKIYISVGETDKVEEKEISEDLNDKQSNLILCSLYNKKRTYVHLHLFFNEKREVVLSVLASDKRLKEIHLSDEIKKYMHYYLNNKKEDKIKCNFMSKWEFLDSNTLHYDRTQAIEADLAKLMMQKQLFDI